MFIDRRGIVLLSHNDPLFVELTSPTTFGFPTALAGPTSSVAGCCPCPPIQRLRLQVVLQIKIGLRDLAARCVRAMKEEALEKSEGAGLPKEGSRESRVPVAPAASRVEKTRELDHRFTGHPASLRNGFNGFLRALPGDRALLSPSSLRSLPLKNLTPASGRQNHTTSPSAASPFVRAPSARDDAAASTASRTNVRDDRDTPLSRDGTVWDMEMIWFNREAKNFARGG